MRAWAGGRGRACLGASGLLALVHSVGLCLGLCPMPGASPTHCLPPFSWSPCSDEWSDRSISKGPRFGRMQRGGAERLESERSSDRARPYASQGCSLPWEEKAGCHGARWAREEGLAWEVQCARARRTLPPCHCHCGPFPGGSGPSSHQPLHRHKPCRGRGASCGFPAVVAAPYGWCSESLCLRGILLGVARVLQPSCMHSTHSLPGAARTAEPGSYAPGHGWPGSGTEIQVQKHPH